jgi:predicted ATPase/DNA-binding SARP family transcriptional activator
MTRLSINTLGQLKVALNGEAVSSFESDKVRALLVYLTVESERLHRREALASLLWPERPEGSALNNLRGALSNLRKAIQDHAATPPYITATRQTIQFNAESNHWLDLSDLTSFINKVTLSSAPTAALEEAISHFQGPFLDGFTVRDSTAFEEWAMFKREELSRLVSRVLQELVKRFKDEGDYERALNHAWKWVELDSLDEAAHRQIMRLMTARGQRTSALAQYDTLKRILADELGVDPSEETHVLLQSLLDEEQVLAPSKPVEKRRTPISSELPIQMTPFIGRKHELDQIAKLLEDKTCRLITLTGPGGVGKTRVALQVAQDVAPTYADGVFFVPLEPLTSSDFLVSATATALKFTYSGSGDPKKQLLNHLRELQALLVLDNFEHLLEGIGFITEILENAPHIKLLVTSRERLNLLGEWILDVGSMDFPDEGFEKEIDGYDSVKMFLSCAHRAQPDFVLMETLSPSVARICQLMQGMPLGIELSATWLRTLSTEQIVAEIEGGLEFLKSSLRDIPDRHRSLWAAFDHSWKLLTDDEQSAFRRLSVFRGGFERAAAEHVAGASLLILSALVDKSLVRRIGTDRYEIHGLIQQYARNQRIEAGEYESIRTRHLEWFTHLAETLSEQLKDHLWGTVDARLIEKLRMERDNFRIALQWSIDQSDVERGLELAVALSWYWYVRADFSEGRHWLEQVLEIENGASENIRALAMHRVSSMAIMERDYKRGVELAQDALQACQEVGHLREVGWSHYLLGLASMQEGNFEKAEMFYSKSIDQFMQIGYEAGEASLQVYTGYAAYFQGEYDRAATLIETGLPSLREIGDHIAVARGLHGLGLVALRRSALELARSHLEEGFQLMVEIGARYDLMQFFEGLAAVSCEQGNYRNSCILLSYSNQLRDTIGTPLSSAEQADYDRSLSTLRSNVTDDEFDSNWAVGQKLSQEEAVTYALDAANA